MSDVQFHLDDDKDDRTGTYMTPDTPLDHPTQPHDEPIIKTQELFLDNLLHLYKKDLIRPDLALKLIRDFHNTVPTHRSQSTPLPKHIRDHWDQARIEATNTIVCIHDQHDIPHALLHLPTPSGGL